MNLAVLINRTYDEYNFVFNGSSYYLTLGPTIIKPMSCRRVEHYTVQDLKEIIGDVWEHCYHVRIQKVVQEIDQAYRDTTVRVHELSGPVRDAVYQEATGLREDDLIYFTLEG